VVAAAAAEAELGDDELYAKCAEEEADLEVTGTAAATTAFRMDDRNDTLRKAEKQEIACLRAAYRLICARGEPSSASRIVTRQDVRSLLRMYQRFEMLSNNSGWMTKCSKMRWMEYEGRNGIWSMTDAGLSKSAALFGQ
jgi:hypothetical protein